MVENYWTEDEHSCFAASSYRQMAHFLDSRTNLEKTSEACSSRTSPLKPCPGPIEAWQTSTFLELSAVVQSSRVLLFTISVQVIFRYSALAFFTPTSKSIPNSTSNPFIVPRRTVIFAEENKSGVAAYNEQSFRLLNPRDCCEPLNLESATDTIQSRAHSSKFRVSSIPRRQNILFEPTHII